jgi:hypothetical protein
MINFAVKVFPRLKTLVLLITVIVYGESCRRLDELDESPEVAPLEQGFKASAAIGYCASIASSAFQGETLPANVTFEAGSPGSGYTGSGILRVHVTPDNPLPFNSHIGDILIAGLWNGNSGVVSIIFADIDILSSDFKFYGLYTVPVFKEPDGDIQALFAEQDIIIGEGSDTLINLSLSRPKFDTELERLQDPQPDDVFAAIAQKVWFIHIDRQGTTSNPYDDRYKVSGGGQVLEARSTSGGVLYHALINTEFSHAICSQNPLEGTAFIQNLKVGSVTDLGNITFKFHDTCNGKADVVVATGKYLGSNGKSINLNWQ